MTALPFDDVQQVLLVLAVLYVVECAWWLRGAGVRLFGAPFAAWSDVPPEVPEADAWRLAFSNPLPWVAAFSGEPFPFPFAADSVLIPVVDPRTGNETFRMLQFGSIERISTADRQILIDGQIVGHFSSEAFAAVTASRLERIHSASAEERAGVADAVLAEMHDVAGAADRLSEWLAATAGVRVCGGLLAITALGLGPLVWAFRAALPASVPLGFFAGAVGLWLCTAVLSLSIPSRVLVAGHATLGHRLIAFLSPATAMRLHDVLGRDVMVRFAPLVIALVNSKGGRADAVASSHLRAAIHPTHLPAIDARDAALGERAARVLAWFHERTAWHTLQAVKAAGRDPCDLLAVVAPEPGVRSYCPRCVRTYLQAEGRCGVCDLPLATLTGDSGAVV